MHRARPIRVLLPFSACAVLLIATAVAAGCQPQVTIIEVTATPSTTPTPTSTPTPTPTPLPTPTPTPLPPSVLLEPMNHQQQTYNNCGPTSVAILLAYYGHTVTQHDVNELIPAGTLSGIGPYLSQYELRSRMYGSRSSVRPVQVLLANGIPVIVGQRLSIERRIGHFRVVHGYDDGSGEFIVDDPLLGADYRIDYGTFGILSRRGAIIPVYPLETDPFVRSLMAELGLQEQRG